MRVMSVSARYRWAVFSRVIAATLGAYAFTWAAIVLVALIWPLPRGEAVGVATMLGFLIYAVVAMWVFSVSSVWRVWITIVGWTAAFAALDWWLMQGGAA